MNPILRLLLGTALTSGFGERFSGNNMGDFRALLDAYNPQDKTSPKVAPVDRITAAFDTLKNMHQPGGTIGNASGPSPFDGAQWPMGPVGAPGQATAQMPQAASPVPMPQPRPSEAPAPEGQPALMSFFQRNAALQKDPVTGAFLDPAAAAQASPGIFQGLFA